MVASWNIAGKTAASSELLPSRIVERQRGIWQSPGGCGAVGVSRRKPDAVADKEWLAVDLLDRKAAVAAIQTRPDITDVLYAGYVHGNGWQTQTEANTALLANAQPYVVR